MESASSRDRKDQTDQKTVTVPVSVYLLPGDVDVSAEGRVSISTVMSMIWRLRFWLGAGLLLGAIAGLIFAIFVQPVYRAELIMTPRKTERVSALGSVASQLGGLAALTGLSIPSVGGSKTEALAILTSRGFLERFIERHKLLPVLFASRWSSLEGKWQVASEREIPSLSDGIDFWREEVLVLKDDRRTGLVTIGIDWTDRILASKWANQLVADLNDAMRMRELEDSQRNIEFLKRELDAASSVELREAIFRLMESEIKSAMVANVQREFAFQVLDAAAVPDQDKYIYPNTLLSVATGALVFLLISVLVRSWLLSIRMPKMK